MTGIGPRGPDDQDEWLLVVSALWLAAVIGWIILAAVVDCA